MSRTKTEIRGKEFPKGRKTKRVSVPKDAPKDKFKKDFGYTSGTHSSFAELTDKQKNDQTYPIKGEDYIKYGYGNGTKKENRTKNFKKEIE